MTPYTPRRAADAVALNAAAYLEAVARGRPVGSTLHDATTKAAAIVRDRYGASKRDNKHLDVAGAVLGIGTAVGIGVAASLINRGLRDPAAAPADGVRLTLVGGRDGHAVARSLRAVPAAADLRDGLMWAARE